MLLFKETDNHLLVHPTFTWEGGYPSPRAMLPNRQTVGLSVTPVHDTLLRIWTVSILSLFLDVLMAEQGSNTNLPVDRRRSYMPPSDFQYWSYGIPSQNLLLGYLPCEVPPVQSQTGSAFQGQVMLQSKSVRLGYSPWGTSASAVWTLHGHIPFWFCVAAPDLALWDVDVRSPWAADYYL